MSCLADLTTAELGSRLEGWGCPPVHAARLLREVYRRDGELPESGRSLPKGLLDLLRREFPGRAASVVARRSAADGTIKLLLRLADGRAIESVLMPDYRPDRASGCLSSQAGCALGCDFCATAKTGWERDLSAGEIVEQFFALRREAQVLGRRLRNVVFMGMGEPLLNLRALLAAIRRLADNALGGLGCRQIMVSTVGLVPGMDALSESGLPVKLAVSLHAPQDGLRAQLQPATRGFPIAEVLAAASRFQARHGRTVTIQYCLLAGVNDSPDDACRLAALLRGRRMHVNLLRYSPAGPGLSGARYEASDDRTVALFMAVLAREGQVAHPRRQRGPDIEAACGQLRLSAPLPTRRSGPPRT